MGWFTRKKIISVSSSAYNLAGDEKDHIKFVPTMVLSKIISNTNFDMSQTLQSALIKGPGMRIRKFGKWARTSGYSEHLGLESGVLRGKSNVSSGPVAEAIPHLPNELVSVDAIEVGQADYSKWAEQWMAEHHPEQIDSDYEVDFLEEDNTIIISFPDKTTYSFVPENFDIYSEYLYAGYMLVTEPGEQDLEWNDSVYVDSPADYPSTSGWTVVSSEGREVPTTINRKETRVITYSDGRPGTTTVDESTFDRWYTYQEALFIKLTFDGAATGSDDKIESTKAYQKNLRTSVKKVDTAVTTETAVLPDGTTRTTTITVDLEKLVEEFSYTLGFQKIVDKQWSPRQVFIYKENSGNAELDAMFGSAAKTGVYMPFILARHRKEYISPDYYPKFYEWNEKAYRKAFGDTSRYSKFYKDLKANIRLNRVDFGFIMFGAAVNSKESTSLRYIFKFLQALIEEGGDNEENYAQWKAEWNAANTRARLWVNWKEAQSNPDSPLFGSPEPVKGVYPPSPNMSTSVYSTVTNFHMIIAWSQLTEFSGTGLGKPDAKPGDIWWTVGANEKFDEIVYSGGSFSEEPNSQDTVYLTWQETPTRYRSIQAVGLYHANIVYKGKGVTYGIVEALEAKEQTENGEQVSGFIFPMHEGIFRSMSLLDQTQMSQNNSYYVMNYYKVYKQFFTETAGFKIIMVIIIIVISVFTAGAGSGMSAGLLGTAASVGASLGFVGTMAIIVGSIANALAAMILSQLIMMGATALFGDKVGAIVGTIASIVAVSYGTSMANGMSGAETMNNMMSAQNMLRFTMAAGEGIGAFLNADTAQILKDTQQVIDDYNTNMGQINDQWYKNLGYGEIYFDPTQLTESKQVEFYPEGSEMFLTRTLLTGSEIAGITNSLIERWPSVTISSELPK